MHIISQNKLLFLLVLFISNYVFADVKSNKLNTVDSEIVYELSDLDQIRDALAEYSRAEDKNNAIYEQNRRAMLDSVELRFLACDTDSDDTLDVFEATQCLPQVARMFRDVDIDNDNIEIANNNYKVKKNQKVSLSIKSESIQIKKISKHIKLHLISSGK